ncbi:hypothetical protein CYLTODRAFT_495329 [Cylindrobasidium torrendii FP15055 ss-10]|uniref:Uncharacterized protein n=1 Tax=Cylindrobasidium torrendii FP15055 ss-10 TaxID=1314674 RepID=A0A0D7ATW7_9AGAR|nr:hypothetical protein CYLTODRAFT_495329 [Cylindrobasidium torrendii FP15055 ss-10]
MSTRGSKEDDPTDSLQSYVPWCRPVLHRPESVSYAFSPPAMCLQRRNRLPVKPPLSLSQIVTQILVSPIGRAWEKLPIWNEPIWLPHRSRTRAGCHRHSRQFDDQHGLYHELVASYQPQSYGRKNCVTFKFEVCVITTQFIGLGLAGLARWWIVSSLPTPPQSVRVSRQLARERLDNNFSTSTLSSAALCSSVSRTASRPTHLPTNLTPGTCPRTEWSTTSSTGEDIRQHLMNKDEDVLCWYVVYNLLHGSVDGRYVTMTTRDSQDSMSGTRQ